MISGRIVEFLLNNSPFQIYNIARNVSLVALYLKTFLYFAVGEKILLFSSVVQICLQNFQTIPFKSILIGRIHVHRHRQKIKSPAIYNNIIAISKCKCKEI